METPANTKGDLQVTGVSRSGRVRKKSSKLMDFKSPDEIEARHKKTKQKLNMSMTSASSPQQNFNEGPPHLIPLHQSQNSDDEMLSGDDFPIDDQDDDSVDSDADSDDINGIGGLGDDASDQTFIDPTVRQSIYMSEKSSKKKLMKDGKIIFGKAHRKDKGKTRFTAYMLWAKEARKQMSNTQPEMDFAAVSRRLGEMWANVPTAEKLIWKRRVKRYTKKMKKTDIQKSTPVTKFGQAPAPTATTPSKFLNRATTGRYSRRNASAEPVQQQKVKTESPVAKPMSSPPPLATIKQTPIPHHPVYKVTGIDPVDVAAHLKLLGDSLTIIGERLKEHEGQITVSGSLSVLLDSLICSLGPLMCLSAQIPGVTSANPKLKENLKKTLDNIAYVMPGL